MILEAQGVGISFGGLRAVDNVSISVAPGQIYSIIGPNGAGKTTFFNLISGVYQTQGGAVRLAGQDVTGLRPDQLAARGLSRTFQNLQLFSRMSALDNVMTGRHTHENRNVLSHVFRTPGMRRQERATRDFAMECLRRVGLDARARDMAGSLSYGAMKRLEIARALAAEPRVLLLDEPAAGCNATETQEIDDLMTELVKSGLSIVLIEHDMKLVMGISDRLLVLDQGRMLAEGAPTEIAHHPDVIKAYLGEGASALTAGGAHA